MRVAGASILRWALCIVVVLSHERQSVSAAAALVFTTSKSSSAAAATAAMFSQVDIIRPGEAFRDTKAGELSIVSFNILAPTYHWLGMDADDKNSQVESDRRSRVPMAIRMAKQANADILCLQEVEGGSSEKLLKELLEEPQPGLLGYDSYLWSPLHPNRKGDVVGLCVAWRSVKHNLISPDCFRRGMVVQLEEIETGATFCIGNVHLPAKPAAIEGRLKAISTTIKSMASCESPRRISALDGTAIIAGDFNCDQYSVAAKLLETGTAPYGTLSERNYKAKVTKEAAFGMKHNFRFKDAYANELRQLAAPVTVALTGRGPGCMDHIFFASRDRPTDATKRILATSGGGGEPFMGKRKARRQSAIQRVADGNVDQPSPLRIDTVLATVDPDDPGRTQTIANGLPNVPEGFPSDHIPIGVLFSPQPTYTRDDSQNNSSIDESDDLRQDFPPGGAISANARRRREAYSRSLVVRRRHNAILRSVTEWLVDRGAREVIRDQPLFKWKWLEGVAKINGKLRAPDLFCILNDTIVVIEVTVSNKPDQMRRTKLTKYEDLGELLRTAPATAGLKVLDTFVILMDEDGEIPDATRQDVVRLAELSTNVANNMDTTMTDAKMLCNHLQRVFAEAAHKS